MNQTPPPFSRPPFTFLPSNPNPNSKPDSLNPQFQNPNPQNLTRQPPDLSATLSTLNGVIQHSQQTLQSLFTLLPLQNPDQSNFNGVVPCPFNTQHLMQPESLFAHFLNCSSSPCPLQADLLPPLNYPQTLKSPKSTQAENGFLQTFHCSDSELCFSLDEFYADFGSNLFYHDCPGVVSLSDLDGVNRTFSLPAVLSVQCANVVSQGDRETNSFERERRKILPSELWATRAEVEAWNEYPIVYSYRVLYAILGLDLTKARGLARWVIASSPRYGVVIDAAMRDHIFLLCRLCLKAILMEALTLVDNRDRETISESMNFSCPIVVQVLMWLRSQLSVLYGEINGKLFAINIFKQCLLEAASGLVIFSLEQKVTESSALEGVGQSSDVNSNDIRGLEVQNPFEKNTDGEQSSIVEESVTSGVIFVSQVVAAVAALHERSLLEGKIKGLRFYRPLNNYQRMAEHDYVSQRADEERKIRPQYRPIIEHDGLPQLKLSNEKTGKTKTREELLAEERDYKRRRMSYRGKKAKRSHLEIMRDIIEDYMDEIKQAGGIGCFEKGTGGEDVLPSKPPYASDMTAHVEMPKIRNYDPSTAGNSPNYHRKQLHSDYTSQATTSKGPLDKDYEQSRRDFHGYHESVEDQTGVSRDKRDREYYSRSPRQVRSSERSRKLRENEMEVTGSKHHETKHSSSRMSKYQDNRSSTSASDTYSRSKSRDRRHRDKYENRSSEPLLRNTFSDRYDPSESHEIYEDNDSTKY